MELLTSKLVTMLILFLASLGIGSLPALLIGPLQLHTERAALSTSHVLSVMSCFGGGVFLATCLLDLIPDVREGVSVALDAAGIETEFPVADFIVAMGLFIILIVEQTALAFKHKNDGFPHGHGHDEERPLLNAAEGRSDSTTGDKPAENHVADQNPVINEHGAEPFANSSETNLSGHSHGGVSNPGSHNDDDCHDLHSPSRLRSLLLLGALSLHSIFEGLAIGIQGDSQDVLTLLIAVVIHKSILAFSLGVNVLKTGMGKGAMFKSLVLFSMMAPLGMTIGIIITEEFSKRFNNSIANGMLQGLATGTFLYITFFEVLPHEMSLPRNRLLKVLSIVIGFSVICSLILYLPS